MSPEVLFYGGIVVCGITVMVSFIAGIVLRVFKLRLHKRLDVEYGKRRR